MSFHTEWATRVAAEGTALMPAELIERIVADSAFEVAGDCVNQRLSGRGRDAGLPAPPAQIRTSGIPAYGSYLGCLAAKRSLG